MKKLSTIIIGAGQAGLAMSYFLGKRSIDHVVLERGAIANSWRNERWDSLRLLTPNWQSRLPGYEYQGCKPDGFRTMPETADFITEYAGKIGAPVVTGFEVTSVDAVDGGFRVVATGEELCTDTVVMASGACNLPNIPKMANRLSPSIRSLSALSYRNPHTISGGGVLVVGASASGVQIASEIRRSGRSVVLAVGEHVRVPRTYRGRDIKWWMNASGILDVGIQEIDDLKRARQVPSLQLIGGNIPETIGLNSLQAEGVEVVGRLADIQGSVVRFSGALTNVCALADLKMNRLLKHIDDWIESSGLSNQVEDKYRFRPTHVPNDPILSLDLKAEGIETVIWATGYRPDYKWLKIPHAFKNGKLNHDGGVLAVPGLYVIGLPFLRKRKSNLIDGVSDDARYLSEHLVAFLDQKNGAHSTVGGSDDRSGFA